MSSSTPNPIVTAISEAWERHLGQLSPVQLWLGSAGISLLTMALCTVDAYSIKGPPPPPGPRPQAAVAAALTSYRYVPSFYRSLVEEDAQKLKLPRPNVAKLREPNRYREEFSGNQTLRIGKSFRTESLRLTSLRRKLWLGEEGRRVRSPHIVLRITNLTDRALAYRVQTEISGSCGAKAVIDHNALSIRAKGSELRTECLLRRKGGPLRIRRIEVLELTKLGYHYVSAMEPRALRFSSRSTEGHRPPKLPPCQVLPWKDLDEGMLAGKILWYDVVDYYSRHSCAEYSFFPSYRWSKGPLPQLPIKPPPSR